jgi:hypothetical protein
MIINIYFILFVILEDGKIDLLKIWIRNYLII